MKIVKLETKFKKYIQDKNNNLNQEGIGLYFYFNGNWIFIPITSQKRIYLKNDNRFLSMKKFGTLLIGDYFYIKPNLIYLAKEDSRIKDEIIFLKKEKKIIEKKLKFQINRSRNQWDRQKIKWLQEYTEKTSIKNREVAKRYAKKAVQSMAVLEHVKMSSDEIEDVIEYKILERTDTFEVKTIFNLKDSWEHMVRTLDNELTLEYIINMNERVANHQALKIGIIRDQINYVSGEFEIKIPIEEELRKYLNIVISKIDITEELILGLFLNIIVKQWFYDGNKRTAFIIANKMLFQLGLGVFIIEDKNKEEFDKLLYGYYLKTDYIRKNRMIDFLVTRCIKRF